VPKEIAVVIGRFQLPELHGGHRAIIEYALRVGKEACVLVGVSPVATLKNLLPYSAVEQMIRAEYQGYYNDRLLHIHPLQDCPNEDLQWSMNIDRFLEQLFPNCNIVMVSGRDSFKPYYHGKHRPVKDYFGFNGDINGTTERENIMTSDPIESVEFRKGIIYGLGNHLLNTPEVA
jgi:nicotinamide mononucleotide adenylyltransferase